MAHTYRSNDTRRDTVMGFKIKRMPPHRKLVDDQRDAETRRMAQVARRGEWSDD